MAHYRKIDTRIWNDEKFCSLTPMGKLAFFFILTHPNMTCLGAMRGTRIGLENELDEVLPEAFMEVFMKGFVKDDPKAKIIVIPNFLKYNKPENPNVVIGWSKASDLIPECDMKVELLQSAKGFVEGISEAFAKAFDKAFPKTGTGTGAGINSKEIDKEKFPFRFKIKVPIPKDFHLTQDMIDHATAKRYSGDLNKFTEDMILSAKSNGYKYKDWHATWKNWLNKHIERNPDMVEPEKVYLA